MPPLSTRLINYGFFQVVQGDYGDRFLILTRWDSSIMLYQDKGEVVSFIEVYDSIPDLLKEYPGFEIIDPSNANERYLPGYEKQSQKVWLPVGTVVEKQPVFKPCAR